jgi:hypothetical protein
MHKPRRGRGAASAFGLALVSMLVLGAFAASAAQASPTWHIDGAEYSGEESVAWSGGSTTFKAENGWEITCTAMSGTSTISKGTSSSGTLTFSSCTVAGGPKCVVKPLSLSFNGEPVEAAGADYEKLSTSAEWTIENCAIGGPKESVSGTIAGLIGEEAVHSSRAFSHANDVATGSSGLSFYGHSWDVTTGADTTLSGSHKGSRYGTGGAWAPSKESHWTVAGSGFYGEESIALSKAGAVTLTNAGGKTLQCETSEGTGLKILGGDESSGQITLKKCAFPEYPKCLLNSKSTTNIALGTSGYIGRDLFSIARERVDVGGSLKLSTFYPEGCPQTGTLTISGSIAATLSTNGIALKKVFEKKAESMTGAPGLLIGAEAWSLAMELETTLSGGNSGKALGVS